MKMCCYPLQPDVVEKLVALREGIPKKDAKEVSQTEVQSHHLLAKIHECILVYKIKCPY